MQTPHPDNLKTAERIVSNIANNINPFSNGLLTELTPSEQKAVMQALCVAVNSILLEKNASQTDSHPIQKSTQTQTDTKLSLDQRLQNLEREAMMDALNKTLNNQSAAARLLGISFRQFRYRAGVLGLNTNNPEQA